MAREDEIRKMSAEELAKFRDWFLEFDARQWDKQIEEDAHSGKLNKIAEKAVDSWRKAFPSREWASSGQYE